MSSTLVRSVRAGLLLGALGACAERPVSGGRPAKPATVDVALPAATAEPEALPARDAEADVRLFVHMEACCKSMNDCKGKGGCKVEGANDCAGQNDCKGLGGCNAFCPR